MESFLHDIKATGTTLDANSSVRMKNPPQRSGPRSVRGKVAVDLGSTLSSQSSSKCAVTSPVKRSHLSLNCEDSQDEMDCLSSKNATPPKKMKAKKVDIEIYSDESGSPVVSRMPARKSRSQPTETATVRVEIPVQSKRNKSPSRATSSPSALQESGFSCLSADSKPATVAPGGRPRPKPAYEQSEKVQSRPAARVIRKFPKPPSLSLPSPPSKKSTSSSVSPIFQTGDEGNISGTTYKDSKIKTSGTRSSRKTSKSTFPMANFSRPSLSKSPRKSAPFPMLQVSPPKSSFRRHYQTDGGPYYTDISSSSSDSKEDELAMTSDDRILTRGGRLPFPLRRAMESASSGSGCSGETGDTNRKKSAYAHVSTGRPPIVNDLSDEEANDSLFLDPQVDPSTLCPYCDAPLPQNPTPTLAAMLDRAAAHPRSHRDPRPTNPCGRRAPLTVFIGVCQRHRFENIWLPKARRKGWKETIDWEQLGGKVKRMRDMLEDIVNDANGEYSDEDDHVDGLGRELARADARRNPRWGPRKRCVFWREMKLQVRKGGMKAVGGVRGQYDTFEKTQPGYYGELGSVIISQTLYTLFPLTSIDACKTHPLTPADFIQRILVPQVGLLLIQDDLGLSAEDALTAMRESVQYGVAMFPHGGGEGGDRDEEEMGVADQMVMEQARRRRKELELEEMEEREAFEREMERKEHEKQVNGKSKEKGKKREKSRREPFASQERRSTQSRPRPRLQHAFEHTRKKGQSPRPIASTTSTSTARSDADVSSDTMASEAETIQTFVAKPRRLDFTKMLAGKKRRARGDDEHPFKPKAHTLRPDDSSREEASDLRSDASVEILSDAGCALEVKRRTPVDADECTPRPRRTLGKEMGEGLVHLDLALSARSGQHSLKTSSFGENATQTKTRGVWRTSFRSLTPTDTSSSSSIHDGSPERNLKGDRREEYDWLLSDGSQSKMS